MKIKQNNNSKSVNCAGENATAVDADVSPPNKQ